MKRNLWIMYAIALLQGMVFYGPIATLYRQAHGLTIFQITLIESISLSLLILLEIPWGIIADKIGCRHTIIFCSALYLISKIIFWKADGFAGFLTVISYGGAAFLSLFLTDVRIHSVKKADTEPFRATIKKAMKNRSLLLFLIAAALLSETHQTITVFLNQLQYQKCGLSDSSIGLLFVAATRLAFPSAAAILILRFSNTLFQPLLTEIQNRQIRTDNRATALSVNSMLLNSVAIGTNLVFGALADRKHA